MLRCNRCGALWATHWLTRKKKAEVVRRHDQECPALTGGENDG